MKELIERNNYVSLKSQTKKMRTIISKNSQ